MLTTVEKVIALQEVDIFSRVSTEHLAFLAAAVEEQTFAGGQTIYRAQDPSDGMYLVVEGQVRLHRGELQIDIAGPGKPFGAWDLLDEEPRSVSATPLEEVRLLRLGKDEFIDLLADNVEITLGVLKVLMGRARGLVGRVGSRE